MNIAELLQDRAAAGGEARALVERGRAVTFADLNRAARLVAAQLVDAGIGPGDRVLVFSPMSADLYAVLTGIWHVGAAAVFVDPSAGRHHLDRCCDKVGPRAFIGVPRAHLLRLAVPGLRRIPRQFSIARPAPFARTLRICGGRAAPGHAARVDAATPALITFTSGSTGEPKATVRSHGFLRAQQRVLAEDLFLRAGDCDLATLPMFVLANLAAGVTSILPDSDMRRPAMVRARPIARQIWDLCPTRLAASPAFLERLLARERHEPGLLQHFDRIYLGGAPVFPRLMRAASAAAPMASVVAVYGSTEAEPIAQVRWADATHADRQAMREGAGLLAGHPVPAIDLRILPDRWGEALPPSTVDAFERDAFPPGRTGEIVVSGDHVLTGYLDGTGDEETKLRVGNRVWHRTGDAGYLDARGRLWLMGRCSAKADDARGTLYPLSVECAAQDIESVERCALVAHEGRRRLAVQLRPGTDWTAAKRAARSTLDWARLDDVLIVRKLPVDRRHNAKVDYRALQRMVVGG